MRESQLIGLTLIPVCFSGMLFNWAVVVAIWRDKSMRSSFLVLTLVKTFCDGCYMIIYSFYITPMIVFVKHTKFWVAFFAIYSFLVYAIVTYGFQCRYIYDSEYWTFTNASTFPVCQFFSMYVDFAKNSIFVLICVTVDVITLIRVMKMRRFLRKQKRAEVYSKKDADFMKQTCGQGLCYILDYMWFVAFPESSNPYYSFFSSLFCYAAVAAMTGLLTILYNSDVKKSILRGKKVPMPAIHSSATAVFPVVR
uniref:7TM GPCR serpentine receptor class x (Srx) domain-containing protein n=1 Tax=Caenorhabditis japonica TaxID=281687 RepID=A0A8R1DPM7_CAEJA